MIAKPVMGLCDVLGNVVSSLSEDNLLLSWTVYYEQNGQISLKVRFQADKNAVSRDHEDVHYKRKSTRQVQRDRDRSHAWHKQRLDGTSDQKAPAPVTPGASSSPVAGIQTRSKTKSFQLDTPELTRGSSTPEASNLNPGAVPFSQMDTPCSDSLLFEPTSEMLILTSPELTRSETFDDTVVAFRADLSELTRNCSECSEKSPTSDTDTDSDHKENSDVPEITITTPAKDKSNLCLVCWFYDQGSGRCQEHG